ncbi:MAG: CvpA family protein [Burkholderiaceae bacterium]|nr:CvpA family protein [Burkholderiaceae bacterium]
MNAISLDAMTGWDWFIVIVVLVSTAIGLWRGMVRTVFGLAAWVVGVLGTAMFAPEAVTLVGMQSHPWVVFVLMFVAVFVLTRITGGLLARGLGKLGLGGADRGLGAVLGVARGVLLIVLAVAAARMLEVHQGPAWRASISRPMLDAVVHWVEPYLPGRISGIRET